MEDREPPVLELSEEVSRTNALREVKLAFPVFHEELSGGYILLDEGCTPSPLLAFFPA